MLLVMLGLQLISCGQDANVNVTKPSLTTAGEELLSKLRGIWMLSTFSEGDCAIEEKLEIPVGRARFEIEDDALLIEPLDGVGDDILLYPIDSVSLSAQVDASSASCHTSINYGLRVTMLDQRTFSGTFNQVLESSDSIVCPFDLPTCQHQTRISAVRR